MELDFGPIRQQNWKVRLLPPLAPRFLNKETNIINAEEAGRKQRLVGSILPWRQK
jgi:hypothetical protein